MGNQDTLNWSQSKGKEVHKLAKHRKESHLSVKREKANIKYTILPKNTAK